MNILITGASKGIGKSTVEKFLMHGHEVVGLDIVPSEINHANYLHFICDVADKSSLPDIDAVEVLINNAGVQDEDKSMDVNLFGVINCTEKYGIQPAIKSIVNVASASAHSGAEFPLYSASKGGVLAYTKNTAIRIAQFGAVCNSISPGGVITDINKHITNNPDLWKAVLNETMLNRWASSEEIAE
jgi:NAD(P)-dependent dehydrogenase (short-subunit alcohol dehydrogenase family)